MRKSIFLIYIITMLLEFSCPETDPAKLNIISNFCQNNGEQFNIGINIILNPNSKFPLIKGNVLLHNIPKPANTFSYYNNSVILQNEKGLRFHYFFKGNMQINYQNTVHSQNKQDLFAEIKNSVCQLKLVIEDNKNNTLINPISYLPATEDRIKPTIVDFMLKQGDKFVSLRPYWKIQKIEKGGTLYLKCYDRHIKNGNNLAPFKIELFIKGVLKKVIKFDSLYIGEKNIKLTEDGETYNQVYIKNEKDIYKLISFYPLAGLTSLKIQVSDFNGNFISILKTIRIIIK